MDHEREKYNKYLCSKEWWAKKDAVTKRAGGYCEKCHKPGRHVHHLTYIRKYHELLEDLILLCVDCHNETHCIQDSGNEDANERLVRYSVAQPIIDDMYSAFLRLEAPVRYRKLAEQFGLVEEFDSIIHELLESLQLMESRKDGIAIMLKEKSRLISLYRTIDGLGGLVRVSRSFSIM